MIRTLLIVSHVPHYGAGGVLYAYGPYAREIEMWADLFQEVTIAAPCRDETPPGDCLPLNRPNIAVIPQRETGGVSLRAKLSQIGALPGLAISLGRAMRQADAVHVRCPGNLGLLGVMLAPLFARRLIAKYAGQWSGYPGEPWTFRLQRALLRSFWWTGPVTVYGRHHRDPQKAISFFTSILTEDQIETARRLAAQRRFSSPLRVLFVGRLAAEKNVHVLIRAVADLRDQGVVVNCNVVGDGPECARLQELCRQLNVEDRVILRGAVEFCRMIEFYEQSDVLVLVSETEGWPKAIAEGMAFGLICIGSERGFVREMLAEDRGLTLPPGDSVALAAVLRRVACAPDDFRAMSARAAAWAQRYSLEGLRTALHKLLTEQWETELLVPQVSAEVSQPKV